MRLLPALVIAGVILLGISTVLVADSPYDPNVVSERNPFAPERPATLTETTATAYLVDYEQTQLYNDLLGSRGYTFDRGDDVRADCTAVSTNQTATDRFRVRLRCNGEIEDTYRLVQPIMFSYTVTYSITEDSQRELSIRGYPYSSRAELRRRPSSAK